MIWAHYREPPNPESAVLEPEELPCEEEIYDLLKGFMHLPQEDAVLEHVAGIPSRAAVQVQTLGQNLLCPSRSARLH